MVNYVEEENFFENGLADMLLLKAEVRLRLLYVNSQ